MVARAGKPEPGRETRAGQGNPSRAGKPEPGRETRAGKAERFEAREESFHRAVRQAYLDLAEADPRVVVIDARPSVDEVQSELRRRIQALLAEVSA